MAVAQRIAIELWRRKFNLLCWAIFPTSLLIVNGMIMSEQAKISLGDAFERSIPPCLMGAALFFSCVGGSIGTIVAEREQGTLKRLLISPLSGTAYFLGIFLAYGAIGIGQALLVYTIAAWVGSDLTGSLINELLILMVSMVAYVGAGFCIGANLARRTEDVNALIAAIGVPLLILSGAFIPVSFFPKTLKDIANVNPIYHMIEALSGILIEQKGMGDIASHLWFLVSFASLTVMGGWLSYRQMLAQERRR